jgi:D-arabinose 5-phosphate isomerase GutQ
VISCTLMVCDAVAELPQASVAVQVLVTLYDPAQAPFVVTSAEVNVNALPHASVAVAAANTGVEGQLIVDGAGRAAMIGAVISWTLMVWDFVETFPQASVAVHVRVTLYDPAHAPGVVTSAEVKVNALPHASTAVAIAKTGVAGQLIVDSAGRVAMIGAVMSWTLIVWAEVEIFPHPSVAVHVRVTLYDPAHAPEVVTSANVNVNALPQLSAAVATANTGVEGQLIVDGAGRAAMIGAVISCTLIVCDAVDEFPQASVAVHVLVTL